MTPSVEEIVALLELTPHPEGGFYRETFRARDLPAPLSGRGPRSASTAIYFLLREGEFSAFHRVISDEVWHHYAGAPLELWTIDAAGVALLGMLGPALQRGQRPQRVVEGGVLQAAYNAGPGLALCGCTVAPGFDFADFELPSRAELVQRFPAERNLIERLTR